jgi:hypothetical protein
MVIRKSGSSSPEPAAIISKTGSATATDGSIANTGHLTVIQVRQCGLNIATTQ